MTPQARIAASLSGLEAHVAWIKDAIGRLEARAAEDREVYQAHTEEDLKQFALLHARMNRLLGGLSLAGLLAAGLGFPWLLGLLGG